MRTRSRWVPRVVMVAAAFALACGGEGTAVEKVIDVPQNLEVQAVGTSAVRISWSRVAGPNVAGYEVQRRENLEGPFRTLAGNIPQTAGRITFFDNQVDPDTYYGYRVVALTSFGGRSASSTTGGAKTPPPPTLIITVATTAPNEASVDVDGYVASVLGPRDTLTASMATNGERRFASVRPGAYTVVLRGLARNCDFKAGDSLRTAQVVDVGIVTETRVRYDVSCRDPKRGSIVVRYEQEGDTTDPNGIRLSITGLLTEPDPVDTARVYARTETITNRIELYRYDNLRGGQYEVTLDDIASVCNVQGSRRRSLNVKALSLDTVRFNGFCAKPIVVDTTGKPLTLEHRWSAAASPNGSKVSLSMTLDSRGLPALSFSGISYDVGYSPAALRFDSSRKAEIGALAVNGRSNPGLVIVAGLETDPAGISGRVEIGKLWFTVIGQTGTSTRTATALKSLRTTTPSTEHIAKLRVEEAIFTVGTFSGSQNQAPVAKANGPYAATPGIATQLTGLGSSDPDGTIASYRWDFGDGTAAAVGETVQHTYSAPGTYSATLTVTDDKGATGTDLARVTVTNSGVPNQPPVARISAPSSATPSSSVTFSGTQSSDVDGTIVSYEWNFGDGATGTGSTTTHVYSAAGTYNVTLKVTDNRAAPNTAQHTLTITPSSPGSTPFTWNGTFGAVDPGTQLVDFTITLDLSTNIPETPGVEELGSYIVDSLKWDPVILRFEAFNFGPGQQQSIDQSDIARGKMRFSGNTLPGQNTGVITIARVRFRVTGGAGAQTTPQTVVGPMIGSPSTGSFNYRPKTDVREGSLTVPGSATQTGTVAGTVSSVQRGNIANATVTISGGFSGTTSASGGYSISGIAVGSRTVTVTNLPSGCTAPAAQTVNVTAGAISTASFTVTCPSAGTTGTVSGTITSSQGGGLAGVSVVITPTAGSATTPVTTSASGGYTVAVPPGTAGTGNVTISGLPSGCTNPGARGYSGLTIGGTVTLSVTVTCAAPAQTGTVTGTVTSSLGGPISGASVAILTNAVTTNTGGGYTLTGASAPSGTVTATAPTCAAQSVPYSGLTGGGTVTVNITLTCQAAVVTYPFGLTWGAITNTGPTGRQVTVVFAINMGNAPGRPDVNGTAADQLVALNWTFQFNGLALTYQSRTILATNLDLIAVGNSSAGITNFAQTSSQNLTDAGIVQLVRATYNIVSGFTGTITPLVTITQARAGTFSATVNVDATVRIAALPTLSIP